MTGLVIGNYRIIDRLGDGGQGKVYRALDTMVEREVAIKALRPEIARVPETLERFRTEAVTLAKLNHPAIAQLYTFFRDGDDFYMVMEYIPGRTLESIVQEHGPMPPQRAVSIALSILEAVGFAHAMGICHRDLKPANIMITPDGRVKVMDFGIAQVLGGQKLTREGRVVGTVEYLAPERIRGNPPDNRADLYSLGIVLFEMLTGKLPFAAASEYELMLAQVHNRPPLPSEFGVDVDPGLIQVLTTALEKDPDARYPDAESFAAALRAVGPATHVALPQVRRPGRPVDWRWITGVLAAFAVVFVVSTAILMRKQEDPWKQAKSLPPVAAALEPAPTANPPIAFDPTPIAVPSPAAPPVDATPIPPRTPPRHVPRQSQPAPVVRIEPPPQTQAPAPNRCPRFRPSTMCTGCMSRSWMETWTTTSVKRSSPG
jgi:serine/threonine protein kinase